MFAQSAKRLCDLQREEHTIEIELHQLLGDSKFNAYREVFRLFGFGVRLEAIILSQIYPLEAYFGADGKPEVKIMKGRNSGRPTTRYLSLRRFQMLPKRGCSNLGEQKKLIRPLLRLFKGYQILVLGDREFHSIKLAHWLHSKGISFVLRQKQGTYICQENQPYQRLQSLGLNPGISFFLTSIQATKQKGFAKLNLAGYKRA